MKRGSEPGRRQRGVTLIELLIGVAVGLFIILGATSVFTSAFKSSSQNLGMTHLDQQLRAAMDVMARNIRRAGYYAKVPGNGTDLPQYGPSNPFQINNYQMTLGATATDACDGNGQCPCITFSYDVAGTSHACVAGLDPEGTADPDEVWCSTRERFGFRLDSADQTIEMRNSSSGPPSCSESGWEDITDDNSFQVTGLTFQYENRDAGDVTKPLALNLQIPEANYTTPDPSGCPWPSDPYGITEDCLQMRTVIITIDGNLKGDPDTTMSIRERVKVGNDRYCTEDSNPPC